MHAHGKEYRQKDRKDRIEGSNKTAMDFVKGLAETHSLAPLFSFLGLNSPITFKDATGTQDDFRGSDFFLESGDIKLGCQDKFRMSGTDIQVEFIRMYRRVINDDVIIISDGGRDLYQIPQTPIVCRQTRCGWKADRDWDATEIKHDLMVFHPLNSEDTIWLKSKVVKGIAKSLLLDWLKKLQPGSEFYQEVRRHTFSHGFTRNHSEEFGYGFDVFSLREESDKKEVKTPTEKKGVACNIAKAICYLPLDSFTEGTDYVVCAKRS